MEESKTASKIEELLRSVRISPVFRQLVPMEAVSGWPVLERKKGRVYVTIPYYMIKNKERGKTLLYPPIALITAEFQTKRIVSYVSTDYKKLIEDKGLLEPAGIFPHEAVKNFTVKDYKAQKKELMHCYDILALNLLESKPADKNIEQRFSELLTVLIEPGLLPYYQSISPKFFEYFVK